jgi:anaerobic magnesium-protoporphyrin IX monomethyl ester cyclase
MVMKKGVLVDLLLVNPGDFQFGSRTEHLGIACLKSYIASKNFSVDIIDLCLEPKIESRFIKEIININPAVIGFSLLNATRKKGLRLIKALRKNNYSGKIVVGGYFATFSSKELLRDFPEIDYVIRGEGELTLEELLKFELNKKGSLEETKGLSFRKNLQIIENPSRPLIEDLDILPQADRKYADTVLKYKSPLRIFGTRGCWGQCTFCDIVGLYGISKGKTWRRRSVVKLVDEIEYLQKKYNTNHFSFNDDQFLVKGKRNLEYVEEFANELEKRDINIKFELMCRADTVSKKVMLRLKSVGLRRVFLGLESFDEKQLKRFKKNITVRQNLKAVIRLYKLQIDVIASVILADAYTTLWDLLNQFVILFALKQKYFNSNRCKISVNHKMDVYRGSSIYHEYKSKKLLTRDHYLKGIDYNLKIWTSIRLRILKFEELLSNHLFNPRVQLREILQYIKYKFVFLQ